jgi:cytochrome c553
VKALKDYKSGTRNDPIMAGMTAGLSPADIENLAFIIQAKQAI